MTANGFNTPLCVCCGDRSRPLTGSFAVKRKNCKNGREEGRTEMKGRNKGKKRRGKKEGRNTPQK